MAPASDARDLVARLMEGYLSTQLLHVAARLGLADLLANGPQSAAQLAAAAGVDPANLHRILRGLTIYGLLNEDDGRFGLTEAGRYLRSGTADSLRGAILRRLVLPRGIGSVALDPNRQFGVSACVWR